MTFSVPSDEQVTIGLAGSSTMASTLLGLAQLSATNSASSCGVTQAGSLAFVGLAAGLGAALGDVAFGAGVGVAVGAVVAALSAGGKPDLGDRKSTRLNSSHAN